MLKKWSRMAVILLSLTVVSVQAAPEQGKREGGIALKESFHKEVLPDHGVCLKRSMSSHLFESKIEMCYPTLGNAKAQAIVEKWSQEGMQESIKMSREYAQDMSGTLAFEKKCREGKADKQEMGRWTCTQGKLSGTREVWEFNNHYELSYASPRYVSVMMTPWAFTGGAHGNWIYDAMSFDLKTGDMLKLSDIFPTQESLEKAAVLLEKKFRLQPHDENYAKKPAIQAQDLKINQMVLSPTGLDVLYAPYILAPYSYGGIRLSLTRAELEELGANAKLWQWP